MPSKHRDPALTVRPPADVKKDAQDALVGRGLEMRSFVVACLTAVTKAPDQLLAVLEPHWPEPKPHRGGRQPKSPTSDTASGTTVSEGQLWIDNDQRSGRTRFVFVTGLTPDGARAVCRAWYDEPGSEPRTTTISVNRFRPTASGYRLATADERLASGVDDPE